jgi:hypothetical protein
MLARRHRPHARLGRAIAFPITAFALLLGATLSLFSGCGLSTQGIPDAGDTRPCTKVADCDDQNPCTTDACTDGSCVWTPAKDGTPAPADQQTAGDCKTIKCVGGDPMDEPDNADVPDDHND